MNRGRAFVPRLPSTERGDLYKMHTYRDALGARSVWIIFPGRNVGSVHFKPHAAAEDDVPAGVGALPLLPGREDDRAELRAVIRAVLGDSTG
jgi:predicted component of viral defense system (DUF524 family)